MNHVIWKPNFCFKLQEFSKARVLEINHIHRYIQNISNQSYKFYEGIVKTTLNNFCLGKHGRKPNIYSRIQDISLQSESRVLFKILTKDEMIF